MEVNSDSEVPPDGNRNNASLYTGDDTEPDLIALFQILIRNRARMRFDNREWCLEDFNASNIGVAGLSMPRAMNIEERCKRINESELKQETLMRCGQLCKKIYKRTGPTCRMLAKREIGLLDSHRFTAPDRGFISSRYLPNRPSVLHGFDHKGFCGTYCADGSIFITACQDNKIRIYDADRYAIFKTIQARDVGWSVLDTAIDPDGRFVAYSSWSENIHVCNIHGENEVHEALPLAPDDRRFCIFSLVYSADGQQILGGSNDGNLYVYDIEHKKVLRILAHGDDVNSVTFADATSQILCSGSDDGICKVWDRRVLNERHPKPVGIFTGHSAGITFVDSRGDGRHLITNSKDQSIKLWDMRIFAPHKQCLDCSSNKTVFHWDYRCESVPKRYSSSLNTRNEDDCSIMTYVGHKILRTLIRCRFSPAFSTGQRYIYTGCASGDIIMYDVLTGEIVKRLKQHGDCTRDVSWHPYKPEIVSTSWDRTIILWTYHEHERALGKSTTRRNAL